MSDFQLGILLEARQRTVNICEPLSIEDYTVQPRAEVSPPKWHLAHTTWFFEELILKKFYPNYKCFDDSFSVLFNSYYKGVGSHWRQGDRGNLSRPSVSEVRGYRAHIDKHLEELCGLIDVTKNKELKTLLEIGLNHEQQHQELLLMDIKSVLSENPCSPKYELQLIPETVSNRNKSEWVGLEEGIYQIGTDVEFSFDNESPEHKTYVYPFEMNSGLVTNGEYLSFINDGGYKSSKHWLSAGWDWVNENKIDSPMYWINDGDKIKSYTFNGEQELNLEAPVMHISYFEADAFARWAGFRLPTEPEAEVYLKANDQECGQLWYWTSSHYSAYPGYKKFEGAVEEYNGKFMCGQFILRGGCFATPKSHYRTSYRNFYLPEQRWMFSGLRLARDV